MNDYIPIDEPPADWNLRRRVVLLEFRFPDENRRILQDHFDIITSTTNLNTFTHRTEHYFNKKTTLQFPQFVTKPKIHSTQEPSKFSLTIFEILL